MKENWLWSYKWEAVFQKPQSNDEVEDDSKQISTTNSSDSLIWTLHVCTNHMYSTKYVKNSIYYNRRTKSIRKLRENPDPFQVGLCFRLRPR